MPELRAHCPRCEREVKVLRPWRGWMAVRGVWYAGTGVLMAATPAIAAEMLFLTPLAIAFLGMGAFVIERSKEPPRCRRCLLALELPRRRFFAHDARRPSKREA